MFGRRSQRDFEDEIRSHIELETERLKARGMSDDDARLAARRHFGNLTMAEDRFYHGRRFVAFDEIARDMRHALRGLKRTPGFLATAVITLTLAIGAVAGMFGVVNTVILRPLPFAAPDRLYALDGTAPGSDLPARFGLGNEFYIHYKENSRLIDGIFNFGGGTSTLRVGDRVERIPMAWPTNVIYATLGVKPILGRLPRAEDRDDAFVISERLWASWFNRDSSVIGKWYFVSDSMKQVVGIVPAEFKFPRDETMLWVSGAEIRAADVRPGNFGTPTVVRLKPGVTPEQAAVEFRQLATQLPARFGAPPAYGKVIDQFRPVLTPMLDAALGPVVKTSLFILLGAVGVVLLVACANVANLFMVRAETRRRDFTVRRAIGASRAQLVRFQLAESMVVALIAGAGAVALTAALPVFLRAAPEGIPRLTEVRLDLPTIGATFILVVIVSMICGVVPAMRASSPDLAGLRAGSRSNIGGRTWGRDALVIAQTALALVLLIGSALLVQSFERLRNVDPGYDVRDIYTFQFAPQQPNLRDGPSLGQMHLMMMDRIRALPGVRSVGIVNNIPLDEGTGSARVYPEGVSTAGTGVLLSLNFTGGDYFTAIGMRVLQGRPFTSDEAYTSNASVILSKSAAEKLWPGQSAIGRRMRPRFGGQDSLLFTVVGVVNDVKQIDWRDAGEAAMYLPLTGPTARSWRMGSPAYVVKSSRAETLRPEIRRLVREIAPEAPVYREFTMEFLARRSMLLLSFTALTLGVLSTLTLILGAVGLYGVLSYVVAQRTREIGVRMALGATAGAVRRQVVSQGTKVVLAGAAIGLVAAYLTTRYLATLLYEVKALDPVAFVAMSATLVAIGLLASYVPARRASSVDPMEALRSD